MPTSGYVSERYRIVPHELEKWIIENAHTHYRTKTVDVVYTKKIFGFFPWRYVKKENVSEEYYTWDSIVISPVSAEVWSPYYSKDEKHLYLDSKEEAKRLIDLRLAKVKADQERADAIEQRKKDNPPEEYP